MDTPFPFGLPLPTAFYLTVYVLTLMIHVVFMNYVHAGPGYLAVAYLRSGGRPLRETATVVKELTPFMLSEAITAGVAPHLFAQPRRSPQEAGGQRLERVAGEVVPSPEAAGIHRHGHGRGPCQRPLGLLAADRHLAGGLRGVQRVEPVLLLEPADDVADDGVVPVLAAEFVVAVRAQDGDVGRPDPHQRHVERAAAQVVHEDGLVPPVPDPVGEGRRTCR